MKLLKSLFLSFLTLFTLFASNALAYSPIVRDYFSVRSQGMGDVRYTTGLYDENFFANPARVTENPDDEFQLPKISLQGSTNTFGTASKLLSSGSKGLNAFADDVGEPLSLGTTIIFPAYYNNSFITDNWAIGVGLIYNAQTVPLLSQTGSVDATTLVAMGPAVTVGRRFLDEHRLSVGVTAHAEVRANSKNSYSVQNYLSGSPFSDALKGGSGVGFDFDLGTTFKPHWTLGGFEYQVAFAINNIAGGKYNNISNNPISGWPGDPFQSGRTYNFGVSATHTELLWFESVTFAIESTDIGNNPNGSLYRTLHVGGEAVWKIFAIRAGINQGYYTAGFGIDLGFFDVNAATYGEELGLNPGVFEDRRYALELGFKI